MPQCQQRVRARVTFVQARDGIVPWPASYCVMYCVQQMPEYAHVVVNGCQTGEVHIGDARTGIGKTLHG